MSEIHAQVRQMSKMLRNLDRWLDKAVEHAKQKSIDPESLLEQRLAPDMFTLMRQIQAACDGVRQFTARAAGKEPPKHQGGEKTFEDIRATIRAAISYAKELKPEECEGFESRTVPLPFLPGKGMSAPDFIREMNVPNTFFHICMAYAILRHNGVTLGKADYIGGLTLKDL